MTTVTSNTRWQDAIAKARAEDELTLEDIVALLESDAEQAEELFAVADGIRRRYTGDWVHLLGVIEFSNICQNQCGYCGLRAPNRAIERYRMTVAEIVEGAKKAEAMGLKTIVLQSGEDAGFTIDRVEETIRAIKAETKLAITLSIGEWSREDYARMRRAGADRYLLKLETSDPDLFMAIHPDGGYGPRMQALQDLVAEDFLVGSGTLVGLPGQTTEMLARDILLFKEYEIDLIGVAPFVPNPHTPLGEHAPGSVDLTLKMMAVTRIVTKNAHIPTMTALTTLDPEAREKAWRAGANESMPILTPGEYREHYQIYPQRAAAAADPRETVGDIGEQAAAAGRWVSPGFGESLKHPPYAQF
ncbi:MAG TPA: [FeFe] hydrogenase H-cluster radical SAM maturase HydE [Stenomitos sp.]